MPVSREYEEYLLDRLSVCGEVFSRRMFGGLGLYLDGLFFALAADNVLYFKVDETNRDDYEKSEMEPFRPFEDKKATMNYYEVPPEILDDDAELKKWAEKAFEVAVRHQEKKSRPSKRKSGRASK
jgi:DNA transformation protein